MKLSISIANTNNRAMLDRALDSIYRNPPACSFEVLVVDNASTDGSAEMVRQKYPQVILTVNEQRHGYPANCNINIRKSSGEYALILNEDIEVLKGSLDIGVDYMDRHQDVGMLGCCMLLPSGQVQFSSARSFPSLLNDLLGWTTLAERFPRSRFFGRYLMSYWPHDTIREVDLVLEAGMLVRRSATEHVGLMDERLFFCFDGPDWTKRLWNAGWKVVFHPQVKIIHYDGQSSRKGNRPNYFLLVESLKSSQYYYRKHHGPAYAFIYRCVMSLIFMLYVLKHMLSGLSARSAKHESLQIRKETAMITLAWYLGGDFLVKRVNKSRVP